MPPKTYRKKPVEIEAMRFHPYTAEAVEDWIIEHAGQGSCLLEQAPDGQYLALHILTLEGEMRADPNDFVIRGVQGEFYPCKPDIFEATYEPA